ncbi:MAG: polysaccharide deacetylase family protein, partial [Patescibacteria group bacterium]
PDPALTVPNGSVEQAGTDASNPANWQQSSWGTNSPSFAWVNDGHTGAKSAKITMSNYTDGDAKWYFDPISTDTLLPGHQYRYTTWYKASAGVIPHAVAMYINADGNEEYFGMPDPQPNGTTDWQQYSETFRVPENATAVSVFLFISQNGSLQVDDAGLNTYSPVGFDRPLLTMTFDDGHEDNANNALPLINQYDFKTTHCFATTFIEGQPNQVTNNVLAFYNSGHEICSHSVTHPFMTTLTDAALTYESQHAKQYLESITGTPVNNFATPYGDYNARVNNELKKHYRSHRTVDEGFNSKDNFDIYRVRVQNIFSTTTAAQVRTWVEQAKTDKTWLVLVYHRIANDPGQYDSYINIFAEHLQTIQQSGIAVKTYQSALDEVTTQL